MNRLLALFNLLAWRFTQLWQWILRETGLRRVYVIKQVDDEPDNCKSWVLYVIEDVGRPWAAAMACPCGCGQVLHMNLIPDTKPVWKLERHRDGSPTLSPSVWRREGCHSHFFYGAEKSSGPKKYGSPQQMEE